MLFHLPLSVLVLVLPLLISSLVIHEYAHARTAWNFGDGTAKAMGRVTLNPLAHLDPFGTIALLLVGFGWAKPVPVNPNNLQPRRLGDIAVTLAGPGSNLLVAVVSLLLLRGWFAAAGHWHTLAGTATYEMIAKALLILGSINIGLCAFNMIPLFPLDGHHILREILPVRHHQEFMYWQFRYGRLLLLALIIGPDLLGQMTGNPSFPDPVLWFLDHAQYLAMKIMGMEG
jgi:Zn-dependent protease